MHKRMWLGVVAAAWLLSTSFESRATSLGDMLDALPAYPLKNIGAEIKVGDIDNWRSRSFLCAAKDHGGAFPSKPSTQTAEAAKTDRYVETCDDGDANLFNGLLCAAGEEIGCEAVRRAQAMGSSKHLGQWYRSPNRRLMGVDECDKGESVVGMAQFCTECVNSFSPDHSLGTLLYLVTKKDTNAERLWFGWLDRNAQTTFLTDNSRRKVKMAWPRLCDIDRASQACIDRSKMKAGGDLLGVRGGACFYLPTQIRDVAYLSDVTGVSLPPITQSAVTSSKVTRALLAPLPSVALDDIASRGEPKFPLHLEATRVLIRMIQRNPSLKYESLPPMPNSPAAFLGSPLDEDATEDPYVIHARAVNIAQQDAQNAYYALLAYGPTNKVKALIYSRCPAPTGKDSLGTRDDWLWLKKGVDKGSSMGWDCVFVAKLYNKMRVRQDLWKELNQKLDPVNKVLSDAQDLLKAAKHRVDDAKAAADKVAKDIVAAQKVVQQGNHEALRASVQVASAAQGPLSKTAAVARRAAREHRRAGDHSLDPVAAVATAAETANVQVVTHASAVLAAFDKAQELIDREASAVEAQARKAAFDAATRELEHQSAEVAKLQIRYAKFNRNLSVWNEE